MTETFTIEIGQKLPSIEELVKVCNKFQNLTINYSALPKDYVFNLTYSLPDKAVYQRKWDSKIFISPSIHNDIILQKKYELYECAKAFRQDANFLMGLMAKTFSINLETLEGIQDLKKTSKKQRGKLNNEWNYFLHGAECQFENVITNQIVEVIIIENPEFGYLDCYFFYNYIFTTERFRSLAEFFDYNYHNICKAIDLLVFEGLLKRFDNLLIHRNVLAV